MGEKGEAEVKGDDIRVSNLGRIDPSQTLVSQEGELGLRLRRMNLVECKLMIG